MFHVSPTLDVCLGNENNLWALCSLYHHRPLAEATALAAKRKRGDNEGETDNDANYQPSNRARVRFTASIRVWCEAPASITELLKKKVTGSFVRQAEPRRPARVLTYTCAQITPFGLFFLHERAARAVVIVVTGGISVTRSGTLRTCGIARRRGQSARVARARPGHRVPAVARRLARRV